MINKIKHKITIYDKLKNNYSNLDDIIVFLQEN